MSEPTKSRVIGYIRVSTQKQGLSLGAQTEKLRAYAVALDLDLVDIEADEGLSAKSLDREGLQRTLARLEAGDAEGLLIPKLDRLTRSVKDLGVLIERYFGERFQLLSVGDSIDTRSASGRLVLNVLMSVAQWEREAIAERVREVLKHLKGQGVQLGGEALGWQRTEAIDETKRRVVVPVKAEEQTILRILELRAQRLSLRTIAETLTLEGHQTKRGGVWGAETVRKILKRTAPGDEQSRRGQATTPR